MTKKKMTNAILDANGGLDSARALATAHDILLNHDLKQPVLYHLVLTGSQSIADYQATIKSLIRRLRSRCRTEYFGAYEVAVDKGGLHAHCFVLIETSKKPPFGLLCVKDGKYLHKLALRHGLNRIHISKPKNRIHGGQFFAKPVGDELLADCLKWATYEFKSRSKEGVQSRETYFNSEFKSNKAKRQAKKKPLPVAVPDPVAGEPVPTGYSSAASSLVLSQVRTSETPNFASAFLAVKESVGPKCALSSGNSWRRISLTTERPLASPGARSIKSSRLSVCPARLYETRNFVIARPVVVDEQHDSSDAPASLLFWPTLSGSKLVPYEPPRKQQSSIAQKILDKHYDLDHNRITIFRPIQEPT